ncbi:GbsR/MarR family transcriptional regulator [Longirhabdus pacifica]|uniref:GbsR/MarR family transcriptional regulator n=1 Tax=Longirhabdus pacifica TaxID=2305227 RepID=UPI0027BA91BF|nr:GbsR/MarR family transcriptional regulator [Longirhabdus pacifica]
MNELEGNGSDKLLVARERVVESMAKNMHLYGVTSSIARLYGLMFFEDHPMTLDEMKEQLGMSKTSMSTSVRTLMDLKMIDKKWMKGTRKDHYAVQEDWYQSFIDFFSIKWKSAVTMNIQSIKKSLHDLEVLITQPDIDEEVKHTAENDISKLHEALKYYDWLLQVIQQFESHHIFDLVPRPDEKL